MHQQVQIIFNLQKERKMGKQIEEDSCDQAQSIETRDCRKKKVSRREIGLSQLRKIVKERYSKKTVSKSINLKSEKGALAINNNFKSQVQNILKEQQVTCSICFQLMVGPILTACGHVFCLHCLDGASFLKEKCPLCRHSLENQDFKCSSQMMTLINYHIQHKLSPAEQKSYENRVKSFQAIETKRILPPYLKKGDFIDLNLNQKWISIKIKQLYNTFFFVELTNSKGTREPVKIFKKSRKIARHRTFTKEPPLRPTYFTKSFNLAEPVLRYIVDTPNYVPRPIPRQEVNLVINPATEIEVRSSWEEFEALPTSNRWMLSDVASDSALEIWNPYLDENELQLFS